MLFYFHFAQGRFLHVNIVLTEIHLVAMNTTSGLPSGQLKVKLNILIFSRNDHNLGIAIRPIKS